MSTTQWRGEGLSYSHFNTVMWWLCYSEKQKLSSLRELYGQLQRSYQHLEKDLGKRKEREAELLTLTEKLSSANAELQAAKTSWETKVGHLSCIYTYSFSCDEYNISLTRKYH